MSTLAEILASQEDLIRQASLALPHDFKHCTYPLGSLRQAVYLCLTCAEKERRGICSACSIACHTNHEQIELFPKRNFRCDCPTISLSHACTLHTTLEEANSSNKYGQNFKSMFCRCGRYYDATKERETMIQCLACEDWFHESCLNLRERPTSRGPTPTGESHVAPPPADVVQSEENDDDGASETSSSGLPHPLISGYEYESFVCGSCVLGINTLRRWAGTKGVMMVVRDDSSAPWKIVGDSPDEDETNESEDSTAAGMKRQRTVSGTDTPEAKRHCQSPGSSNSCLAPPPNPVAQHIFTLRNAVEADTSLGMGDIFLTEGWRERWCRCGSCLLSLEANTFLLEEEETYEPPKDPDSGLSLEELGMRALQRLPRDRAIDGILAFNAMRDNLVKYLRPFAQEGHIVKESDVRSFFESLTESAKQGRKDM